MTPSTVTQADQVNAITAQLQLAQAELDLNTARLAAIKTRGATERALIEAICQRVFKDDSTKHEKDAVQNFAQSHKSLDEAEQRILEVDVAKIKSRCEAYQQMLKHLDQHVAAPPSRIHIPQGI